jgi:hypothetical protein
MLWLLARALTSEHWSFRYERWLDSACVGVSMTRLQVVVYVYISPALATLWELSVLHCGRFPELVPQRLGYPVEQFIFPLWEISFFGLVCFVGLIVWQVTGFLAKMLIFWLTRDFLKHLKKLCCLVPWFWLESCWIY